MPRLGVTARVTKWGCTLLCLALAITFLYSTRRAVEWRHSARRFSLSLMTGAFWVGWRDASWRPETDVYAGWSGWTVASYGDPGGSPPLTWWVERGHIRTLNWVALPLWIPFFGIGALACALWYRDRRATTMAFRRFVDWLRPRRQKRLRVRIVLVFCMVHLIVLISAVSAFHSLYPLFENYRRDDPVRDDVEWAFPVLFWTTPLWAFLWAALYVWALNRLRARGAGHYCAECGYDLAGNVSGRCPECGVRREDRQGGVDERAIR